MRRAQCRLDIAPGADAVIPVILIEHSLDGILIALSALGLIDRTLVPVEPEPLQIFDCLLVGSFLDPRAVEVLDSEDNAPTVLPRQQPVDQEGSRVAQVQRAGG